MVSLKHVAAVVALAAASLAAGSAQAEVEIRFWHSMEGSLGDRVNSLADRFNRSQKNYKVVPEYKGGYAESMAAAIEASRAGKAPDIVQIYDVGSATIMAPMAGGDDRRKRSIVKPFYQVMSEGGRKVDPRGFLPAVASYYTDKNGRLLSLPFDSSTPVFFFNKDAFRRAGLDPDTAPKTWPEVQAAANSILETRAAPCSFTTGSQSWIHVENLHAWDNEEFATKLGGYGGLDSDLVFNDKLEVRHIALLSAWLKGKLYSRSRSADEAQARFAAGECAMLTSSSAAYAQIKKNANFNVAVARFPYYDDYRGAPQNTIVGGDSLWAMAGKKPATYKGIAQFFGFLLQPEIQAEWHEETGSLPLTLDAYALARKHGYYANNPGAEISVLQMTANKPNPLSKGIHLGDFAQIRQIINEELETVWNGDKTPKQALDDAVRRGNELLRRFEKASK